MTYGRELIFYQMDHSIRETLYVFPFYLGIFFKSPFWTCFNRFASVFIIIFPAESLLYFKLQSPWVHCQSVAILLVLYFATVTELHACTTICSVDSTSFSMTPSCHLQATAFIFYSSSLSCTFPPVPCLCC